MIIACEKCNARFKMDEKLLKPEGSKVRCAKCKQVFTAYPPSFHEESEPSENSNKTDFSELDDLLREGGGESSGANDDLDFSDIDDLFGDKDSGSGTGSKVGDLEDISSEMKLSPDTADSRDDEYEPKVEFDETDEFSKYGTLEFNVSDMYKTLGIEVESKIDDKDLSDLEPVISAEGPGELDLSGIDDMLEVSEEDISDISVPGKTASDKTAGPEMDIDLSDLDDMLVEEEKVPASEDDLKLDMGMDFEDDDDTVNAQTEVFNIEDINNLDLQTSKSGADKFGSESGPGRNANADDDMELLDLGLEPDDSDIDEVPPDLRLEPEEGTDDELNLSEASLDFEDALSEALGEKEEGGLLSDLESEITEGKVKAAEADEEISLDLDLGLEPEAEKPSEEPEELSLDLMDMEEGEEKEPAEASEDFSLDLDLEGGEEPEDIGLDLGLEPEAEKPSEEPEELSLDLMDMEEGEEKEPAEASEDFSLDLDLEGGEEPEDIGLDLGLEPEAEKPSEEPEELSLDLMDMEEGEEKEPAEASEELSLDLDLEGGEEPEDIGLDLGLEPEAEKPSEEPEELSLDLMDMEGGRERTGGGIRRFFP
ncbi:MAG: zinc-ribbon domain-containing protein [Desulfobacterales bacterium]